jgi:hypothetical protein
MLVRLAVLVVGVGALLVAGHASADEAPTKAVVFVPPPDIEGPLHDALTAQLSGVAAELVVEHFVPESTTLRQRVDESRSFAAAHQAVGVFWLDTTSAAEWLVYLAEPGGSRVLMRRVPIGPDGSVAAMEAVAVITRESTTALLAGQTIGMTEVVVPGEPEQPVPVVPTVPPPAPIVPPAKPRTFGPVHGFSLSSSYYADAYAKGAGVSSGIGFAASWSFWSGFRAGATFVFFQPAETNAQGMVLLVRRYPIGIEAGYALSGEKWLFGLGLRTVVEITSRHVAAPPQLRPDATRAVVFLSPRLRFDYRVSEAMSLFVAAGADFALNGFSFVNRVDDVDRPILEPFLVRPAGEIGAAFWP